jgi:hypothetical protein
MEIWSTYYCKTCGIVRESDAVPWCRHNDPEFKMPATRMVTMPLWHPLAAGRSREA